MKTTIEFTEEATGISYAYIADGAPGQSDNIYDYLRGRTLLFTRENANALSEHLNISDENIGIAKRKTWKKSVRSLSDLKQVPRPAVQKPVAKRRKRKA
jgi:hypothetical protein